MQPFGMQEVQLFMPTGMQSFGEREVQIITSTSMQSFGEQEVQMPGFVVAFDAASGTMMQPFEAAMLSCVLASMLYYKMLALRDIDKMLALRPKGKQEMQCQSTWLH
jgi:hypothetical protein